MFCHKLNKYEFFQPLKVVGRGSVTQLQVDENLNYLLKFKFFLCIIYISQNKLFDPY